MPYSILMALAETFAGTVESYSEEQLDKWIAANAKLPAPGIVGYWCKHCNKLVSMDHTRLTPLPLWKLLLRLKGHSLPRRGQKRRELITEFKEMAKRFENQTNIRTVLLIWGNGEVLRTIIWDGHEKKWVVDMKKPKKRKVVKKVVKKKKAKKRVRRRNRKRCKGCNTLFSPTGRQIYCNRNCGQKAWQKSYNQRKREE